MIIPFIMLASFATSPAIADEAAPAPNQCRLAAIAVAPVNPDATAQKADSKSKKSGDPAVPEALPAVLTLTNKPLDGALSDSMLQLIKMMGPTRATGFSFKEMEGKEQGTLVFGVDLAANYTLELVYASDFRTSDRFALDKVLLVRPNGKDETLSKNPLNNDGTLSADLEIDPKDFPELAGQKIDLPIFSHLDQSVVHELRNIAPRLELLTKHELRALSKVKSYAAVRAVLRIKAASKIMRKYIISGPFKQVYSLTIGTALSIGMAYAISVATPHQVKDFLISIDVRKHHSSSAAPVPLSDSHMPKKVRRELETLETNVDRNGIETIDRAHYAALLKYLKSTESPPEAAPSGLDEGERGCPKVAGARVSFAKISENGVLTQIFPLLGYILEDSQE